jgi:hypothetical protein
MARNWFKTWWVSRNGYAKTVTVLCAILILQIGVCFASPGEPAWFDALFHIKPGPDNLRIAFAFWEAVFCCVTAFVLVMTLILWSVTSSSADEKLPGIFRAQRDRNTDTEEKSGDRND